MLPALTISGRRFWCSYKFAAQITQYLREHFDKRHGASSFKAYGYSPPPPSSDIIEGFDRLLREQGAT